MCGVTFNNKSPFLEYIVYICVHVYHVKIGKVKVLPYRYWLFHIIVSAEEHVLEVKSLTWVRPFQPLLHHNFPIKALTCLLMSYPKKWRNVVHHFRPCFIPSHQEVS